MKQARAAIAAPGSPPLARQQTEAPGVESTNGIGRLTGAGYQDFDCSASKFSGENRES